MHRMIVAAMIGNVLEWFDFVVYGFFAVTIAEVFSRRIPRPGRC
jgi:MHS family proline/betaine transporter-like MFS transporter